LLVYKFGKNRGFTAVTLYIDSAELWHRRIYRKFRPTRARQFSGWNNWLVLSVLQRLSDAYGF